MNTTKIRQVDRNGNVSYRIDRNGITIGIVHKTGSGYEAELKSGLWTPAPTIKDAIAWIEAGA